MYGDCNELIASPLMEDPRIFITTLFATEKWHVLIQVLPESPGASTSGDHPLHYVRQALLHELNRFQMQVQTTLFLFEILCNNTYPVIDILKSD
jgi:hypothetical protein